MRIYNKIAVFLLVFLVSMVVVTTEADAKHARFDGLWKKDCKDNTGLQIMQFIDVELYFISFCGRGGCMPSTKERPNTTIEDDPNYNIIDDEHIRILEDGEWENYVKCIDL